MATILQGLFPELREKRIKWKHCWGRSQYGDALRACGVLKAGWH